MRRWAVVICCGVLAASAGSAQREQDIRGPLGPMQLPKAPARPPAAALLAAGFLAGLGALVYVRRRRRTAAARPAPRPDVDPLAGLATGVGPADFYQRLLNAVRRRLARTGRGGEAMSLTPRELAALDIPGTDPDAWAALCLRAERTLYAGDAPPTAEREGDLQLVRRVLEGGL